MFLNKKIFSDYTISKTSRAIVFSILLSLWSKTLQAQERSKENNTELRAAISLNKINSIDKNFSSLIYSGTTPGCSLAATLNKRKSLLEFDFFYTGGNIKVTADREFKADESYYNFSCGRLYTLNKAIKHFKYMLGGNLDILYAERKYLFFTNRKRSYEFAGSFCLAFKGIYSLDKSGPGGFSIIENIAIPIVSFLAYPAFGTEQLPGDIDGQSNSLKAFARSSRIAGFGSFQRVKNSLAINKNIFGKHQLSLAYNWDFYNIADIHNARQAIHSFNLCYALIF